MAEIVLLSRRILRSLIRYSLLLASHPQDLDIVTVSQGML
jgi:hypothetical protein